ncbi:MAG: CHAT domain-containing protein [Planctomycetota bacterium]
MKRIAVAMGLLSFAVAPVHGADAPPAPPAASPPAPAPSKPPPTPTPTAEQAADAVLAAIAAKDDSALKALASKDDPDPWLVADELIRRAQHDAAEAFAKAAPRVDVEQLPAYVASRRGKPEDPERRERLAKASATLRAGRYSEALAVLETADSGAIEDVAGVRWAMGRGLALRASLRRGPATSAFLAAGEAAERFGWLARAARAFQESAASAYDDSAFAVARDALRRAFSVVEREGDEPGAARVLGNLGLMSSLLGDYEEACSCLRRALEAHEKLGSAAGVAGALGNLGNVYAALGDGATALALHLRARATMEAAGDRAGAAASLINIGIAHKMLGDNARALRFQESALAAGEALGSQGLVARALSNLGNLYELLGDADRALRSHERAALALESQGDRLGAALVLTNIGNGHFALGEFAKALTFYERAVSLTEDLRNGAGLTRALGGVANAQFALGDHRNALKSYERALSTAEALRDRLGVCTALGNLGRLHYVLRDFPRALGCLERAARGAEEIGAGPLLVDAFHGLSMVHLRAGDAGLALADARRAVTLLRTLVGGLGDEQGATARGQYTKLFSTGLSAAAALGDPKDAAFFLESGRAGSLLEALDARETLRRAALPEELRMAQATALAHEARARVAHTKALDGGDLAAVRARGAELKTAQAAVQEVFERIQREAKKAAGLWYPVAAPIEDLQRSLAVGDALVLYGLAEGDEAAYALVLTGDAARIVPLGATGAIVAACEALEGGDASIDAGPALARLRDLLVKPLGLSGSTKRLLVSPQGALSYVPFAALVPDLSVASQPSGTTYGVLLGDQGKRGTKVLAVADPDYTVDYAPISLGLYAPQALASAGPDRGGRLAQLPGTRAEATAVGDVVRFGKDASEGGLRAALAATKDRWHAVHFACHGLVSPDRPALSSLALTPDGENDGFLTALEVLQLEIPSDLVVLSACETGKGRIAGGEGILGLTRAFMYAGSPRVICSLWKVDDAATAALMTKFYELWNPKDGSKGLPTAEALRQAQAFVRGHEKWKHPYYWAAWVLWGLPD